MSPLFRRFGFRLALILVLVHPGCSDQKSVEKETTPSTTSPGQEAVPLPEPTETGFAVPGSGVEPPAYDETMGGWDTERIAEEGKSLLKKALTSALETSESPSPPKFLSPDFSAYLVDPEQLKTVYSKGSLTLVESKDASPTAADWPPFAMLLADQWVPDSAHLALKVVGVAQPEPASARLDLRLQVDGELPEEAGREQRNAVLESRWSVDGADLKLTSLTMNGWTIARAQRGTEGERLFTDRATAVLGGNASYHKQMIPGLDHWLATFDNKIGMLVGGWTGLAIGDANGDGLDDLYVCQSAGLPNRLYIQQPDGTAVDVSSASGIDWIETTRSALFADFDNDGDQDLVLGLARGLVFQANDGRGNFKTAFTQTLPAAVPYSLAAGDYDQDGRLDLFVCCYNQRGLINRNEVLARPIPYHDANSGGRNVLLRNEGKFRFTHVTRALGLDEQSRRYSYAAAWEDFDNDGDLDLYVANDFGRNNLFRNDRDATGNIFFTDVAEAMGVLDIAAGMSTAWGDYDNDGFTDLYVSNMFSSAGNRIAKQQRFLAGSDAGTRNLFLRHARGNSLFRNQLGAGTATFEDVSETAGVTLGRWAWGSLFSDLNNDGLQDLVVANGFITHEDTGDL